MSQVIRFVNEAPDDVFLILTPQNFKKLFVNDVKFFVGVSTKHHAYLFFARSEYSLRRVNSVRRDGISEFEANVPGAGVDKISYKDTFIVDDNVYPALLNEYQSRIDKIKQEGVEEDKALKDNNKVETTEEVFDQLIRRAIRLKGSSDLHFIIKKNRAFVKCRTHGLLNMMTEMSVDDAISILRTAYNTLSEPDSRKGTLVLSSFQDCVIQRHYPEGHVRLRFASSPIEGGFKVVIRLLNMSSSQNRISFKKLGYSDSHIEMLNTVFRRPQGMVILAGTTSSGKSTSLKTGIETLHEHNPYISIHTIEEPAEYVIDVADQVSVTRQLKASSDDDSSFVQAIRTAMRQDPDVLMIGEIRDSKTANLAKSATQSGHQVLSTVHAASAIEIVDRLAAMGIDYNTLSQMSFLVGLIYQKLTPTLCAHCKIPFDPEKEWDKRLVHHLEKIADLENDALYIANPEGCEHCCGTDKALSPGISGRTVCAEVIQPTGEMLKDFSCEMTIDAYTKWRNTRTEDSENFKGKTALEHAIHKMRNGLISPQSIEHTFGPLDFYVQANNL